MWLFLFLLVACGDDDAVLDAAVDTALDDASSDTAVAIDTGEPITCGEGLSGEGDGTYYDADGTGACGFGAQNGPLFVAAMNAPDWSGSAVCGMCVHITGPDGEVDVRIVDLCPECASGDLDLSPDAFDRVAEREQGRVPITWTEVSCETTGPALVHVKDGSHEYWAAFQLRNARHRVVSLEVRSGDGTFTALERTDYGYFVQDEMPGESITLRATDPFGGVITIESVPVLEETDFDSGQQFSACE